VLIVNTNMELRAMTQVQKKIAIVTGAARGIGAAVAQRLASDGFAVVINYASSSAEADASVENLVKAGHQAIAVKADVSKAEDVRRIFDITEQKLGTVDVLVNNAGIMKVMPLADTSDEVFEQTFSINVQGTFNTLREAATRLNNGGRIINFSTSVVGTNLPGYAVYAGTKAAVET
jgi:3-oxoacyl-[acyl-carrier protein] reductase